MAAVSPPFGTVTFLFTDIEGSTRLWEQYPAEMQVALEHHDGVLRSVIEAHRGYVFSTAGDMFAAAFARADDAIQAAVVAQQTLVTEQPSGSVDVRVRMGVSTGEAQERDGDYFGGALNRTARLMTSAHGGQILMSDSTYQIVRWHLPAGVGVIELGEVRLRDLATAELVWQLIAEGLTSGFGPLRTAEENAGNLALPLTVFVGRDSELRALTKELATSRLVTVTGVGGGGKTRLAIEVGAAVADEFPDGVWLCELAPVLDPASVPSTLAEVLGVRPQPGLTTTEAIVDRFARQRALIVVDNCEHVLDASRALVAGLLAGCAHVRVLTTSREPLGIAGEHVWPIPALDPDFEGVELFCARATAADATFAPDAEDRRVIAELCGRLDGVPLSIELAAARIRAFTPAEIAARLDDGFRLLRGGHGPERHQNLQAVVDWSYRLLDENQRQVFDRLSVFAGSFDARAAEKLCAVDGVDEVQVVDVVAELVDRSLVTATREAGHTRYMMLETLRQYGQQRLDEQGDRARWWQRHLDHYVTVADQADLLFTSTGWDEGGQIFNHEWDNLRSALGWSVSQQDLAAATKLIELTSWYAALKLRHEHKDWAHQTLALASESNTDPPTTVAGIAAWWAINEADYATQAQLADAGLQAAPSPTDPSTNWCWHAKTVIASIIDPDNHDTIEQVLEGWAGVAQRPRDRFHQSLWAFYRSGWGHTDNLELGVRVAAELSAEMANPSLGVWAECARGHRARAVGQTADAISAYRRTLELAEQADHRVMDASAALFLVMTLDDAGGPLEQALDYTACLKIMHQHHSHFDTGLWALAHHLHHRGHTEPAAVIAGHITKLASTAAFADLNEDLAAADDPHDVERWTRTGAACDPDQILAFALDTLARLQTAASGTP